MASAPDSTAGFTLLGTLAANLAQTGGSFSVTTETGHTYSPEQINAVKFGEWLKIKYNPPQGPLNLTRMMDEIEKAFPDGTELADKVDALYQKFIQKLKPEFDAVFGADESRLITEWHLANLQQRLQTHYENQALETIWRHILAPHFNLRNDPNLQTHTAIRAWFNDPTNAGLLLQITELCLSNLNLKALPPEIGSLSALQILDLRYNQLTSLPEQIGRLTALQTLFIEDNQLVSLPEQISNLTRLRRLDLRANQLTSLPKQIGNLRNLQMLNLGNNHLTFLPEQIGSLTALRVLYVNDNQLTSLPDWIGVLTTLQILSLDNNNLRSLPEQIGNLTALQRIHLSNNQLTSLPVQVGKLKALKKLMLYNNQLTSLPNEIGDLIALEELCLSNNQLASFPEVIRGLTALEWLNLSKSHLTSLPDWIGELIALKYLYINDNQLTSLPDGIGRLRALQELRLNNNRLVSLPGEVGNLTALRSLDLGNNQLTSLPKETENLTLTSLQQIELFDNPLMFISFKLLKACPNAKDIVLLHKNFMAYPTESSLGNLFKLIASNTDPVDIQNTLEELDPSLKKRIAELANVTEAGASSYPSQSASSSSGASSSSSSSSIHSAIDENLFENIPRLGRAVKAATVEKFERLSQEQKHSIYRKIWELAESPETDNPTQWGEHHAFDNMLRFVDALEAITN